MYSNLFFFTTASFNFLIHNINVTFYLTLMYFNFFRFTTASFRLLVYNLNINFSTTLTYSNFLIFTTACSTPMWYVRIKILIGGVIFFTTCSVSLIHKKRFFLDVLDVSEFLLFLTFFSLLSF